MAVETGTFRRADNPRKHKICGVETDREPRSGELSQPAWMDEQYFLDLEREAFKTLCGYQKTQERIWAMLQSGKPLRN